MKAESKNLLLMCMSETLIFIVGFVAGIAVQENWGWGLKTVYFCAVGIFAVFFVAAHFLDRVSEGYKTLGERR